MLQYVVNKLKNIKLTLRTCVLAILITFFIAALSIILPIVYYRMAADMSRITLLLMSQVSSQVYYRISEEIYNIEVAGKFTQNLINTKVIDPNNRNAFINYMTSLMKIETQTVESVQSVFWGDESGNFIMADKQLDGSIIATETIQRTKSSVVRQFTQRDKAGNIVHSEISRGFQYDPRVRPWYIEAKTKQKPGWTDLYPYRLTGFLGTTYTTPIYEQNGKLLGVFILNVRVDFLRRFIEGIHVSQNSLVYLLQDNGVVVAYPHLEQQKSLISVSELKKPQLIQSYEEFKKSKQEHFSFEHDGAVYLSIYKPIERVGNHVWYIVVVGPQNDFYGNLEELDEITIWLSCFILLIGFVVIYFFLQKIMRPVSSLIIETEKIKNFELESNLEVGSRIKEIFHLSKAIDSMKKGLRSFQKYVPATLVRQLIDAGEDVRVGGVRKRLAIFFSDIKDFTHISEHTEPDKLMAHICEYFEELSHIIIVERGTIDKFIGDSIMAIWGAPLPEVQSCQQAAKAALLCEQRLMSLNKKWKREGKDIFVTRIGLHVGDAIVGNVGSSERLSYTAIGDAINMASRLEGLNKMYGTRIMTSEAFYNEVKDQFKFRKIDCVTVKGKEEKIFIYELLGETQADLEFDLDRYIETFEKAFIAYQHAQWDEAITYFHECMKIHSRDSVAKLFIKRCEHFKLKPPEAWDGVWHISKK